MNIKNDELINKWERQSWAAPAIFAKKDDLYSKTIELLEGLDDRSAENKNLSEKGIGFDARIWRKYYHPLSVMGLVEKAHGRIFLTDFGYDIAESPSQQKVAIELSQRVKLFAEILNLFSNKELSIREVFEDIKDNYDVISWKSESAIRARITWLEVLGMIEWTSFQKLRATSLGVRTLDKMTLIPAGVVLNNNQNEGNFLIPPAPEEIENLLIAIEADPALQDKRSSYNIWAPSPEDHPSKIDNLLRCVEYLDSPSHRNDLLNYIADSFGLRRSSVDSMMPFLRSCGLIKEIKKNIYVATPIAKSWVITKDRIDFIRIFHAHMKFAGEILDFSKNGAKRAEIYAEGSKYGLNKEKIRWRISFLVEANLLSEISWTALKTTGRGLSLLDELPLSDKPSQASEEISRKASVENDQEIRTVDLPEYKYKKISSELVEYSKKPHGGNQNSGVAFEKSIEKAFKLMGFDAMRIGGSGDTDILVQWFDENNEVRTAIVDAKSSSSGTISHTSISDVAIESHKEKHLADGVLIVAPGFSGETIYETARRKNWALVSAEDLADILLSSFEVGVSTRSISNIFLNLDGAKLIREEIDSIKRELDLVRMIISRLLEEGKNDEPLSARDISLIERNSSLNPSVEELLEVISIIGGYNSNILRKVEKMNDPKHETYLLGEVQSSANRLRAMAHALEAGIAKN